jgi:hypothetical protein
MINSWGCELEFGDVDRNLTLPKELGSWNYFETDIVNQREPFWGIASDPNGIDPPFGGEINTRPTKTWKEQLVIIEKLIQFFIDNKCEPTVSCVSNTHVHANIGQNFRPMMDRLLDYTEKNQKFFVDLVYDKQFHVEMEETQTALEYLNYDSGRLIEEQKFELLRKHKKFFDVFKIGKNSNDRYAINFQSLKYNQTVEFRCFRATLDMKELANCFKICELFLTCALNNGPNLESISAIKHLAFPKLNYDHSLYTSWETTKKPRVERFKEHNIIVV